MNECPADPPKVKPFWLPSKTSWAVVTGGTRKPVFLCKDFAEAWEIASESPWLDVAKVRYTV